MKQVISTRELKPGVIVGNLTAIRFVEIRYGKSSKGRSYWLWHCTCGKDKIIRAKDVLNGNTISCGCLTGRHSKGNSIFIETGIGYCALTGKRGNGKYFIFSPEDIELVKKASWFLSNKNYVTGHLRGEQIDTSFHRFVMGFPKDVQIDHINRNKLDNRRENLRMVDNSQNQSNRISCGVYKTRNGTFQSEVKFNGCIYYLGTFSSFDAARSAYISKKNELCGEYSPYSL